jgi:hypothetical protein
MLFKTRLNKLDYSKYLLCIAIFVSCILMSIPLLSGRFFEDSEANKFPFPKSKHGYSQIYGLDFHHLIPSYIINTINYLNSDFPNSRLLLLPLSKSSIYRWGYSSSNDILMESQRHGVIMSDFGEGFKVKDSFDIKLSLFLACIENLNCKNLEFVNGLKNLSIGYIILRNDFRCDFLKTCLEYNSYIYKLLNLNNITYTRIDMEQWVLLKIKEPNLILHATNPLGSTINILSPTKLFPSFIFFKADEIKSFVLNVPNLSGWLHISFNTSNFDFRYLSINKNNYSLYGDIKYKYNIVIYFGLLIFLLSVLISLLLFYLVFILGKKYNV